MASPQLEDGHSRLANELQEQFFKRRFTERDQVVIRYVERYAYGYGRKACAFSTRAIADATGLHQPHVRATVNRLVDAQVLTVADGLISIQKDHDRWTIPLRGVAYRIGAKSNQVGAHQVGAESHRNGTHQNGATHQVGSEKRTKSVRPTGPDSATGADVRTSKEKRNDGGDHDLPPSPPEVAGPKFTDVDLAVLKEASAGLLIGPRELPAQIGIYIRNQVRSGELSELVLQAYHSLPPATLALWLRAAMREAREKAQRRTAIDRYAASIIASALKTNTDLLNPNGPPQSSSNVVNFPAAPAGPYVEKPWGWLWASHLRGTTCDREYIDRLAQRAHDKGNGSCKPAQALALLNAGGVEAAMDYVWANDPRNKARNDAAV